MSNLVLFGDSTCFNHAYPDKGLIINRQVTDSWLPCGITGGCSLTLLVVSNLFFR